MIRQLFFFLLICCVFSELTGLLNPLRLSTHTTLIDLVGRLVVIHCDIHFAVDADESGEFRRNRKFALSVCHGGKAEMAAAENNPKQQLELTAVNRVQPHW